MDSGVTVIVMVVGFAVVALYLLSRNKVRQFGMPSKTKEGGGEKKEQDQV